MRIRIRHQTTYRYDQPAKSTIQHLRLTPRNYDGQHVSNWRIDVDRDCRLRSAEDAFGNILHRLTAEEAHESISTLVEGEVTTFDTAGVASGGVERFPTLFYLRETPLTAADDDIRDCVLSRTNLRDTLLARLHGWMASLHERMTFDTDATHATTTASAAFGLRKGVCQDFAHVFIAGARLLGAPARYVSGYYLRSDTTHQLAGHAWAEAYVEDLGWVGFDPAHRLCPDERYVRLAIAPDYTGAAPIRGARMGGGREELDVAISVTAAEGRVWQSNQ
jgi:transglutaminase-like putative cysteine protease